MPGPILETPRLILRPPEAGDLEPWAAMMGDPQANRYLGGAQPRAIAWRSLSTYCGAWTVRGFSNFSVVERSSGRWIGHAGPWQPDGWPGPEISWSLARAAWGRGYATEAARACIDWAFDRLGWSEVIHLIAPENAASIAVAKRLGSERIGPTALPPPFAESVVDAYGQKRPPS